MTFTRTLGSSLIFKAANGRFCNNVCFNQKRTLLNGLFGSFLLNESRKRNEAFLPVRDFDELSNVLLASNKIPLILNFTLRGDVKCDRLTGAMTRIVLYETDKSVNCVDIEMQSFDNRNIPMRYGVSAFPSLVALRKGFPVDRYAPKFLDTKEVDWYDLKSWIEGNAD